MYQGWAVTVERLKELWPAKVPALVMRGEHDFVFKVFWPLLDQQFYGDLMLLPLLLFCQGVGRGLLLEETVSVEKHCINVGVLSLGLFIHPPLVSR
jgi:hypothetical protein